MALDRSPVLVSVHPTPVEAEELSKSKPDVSVIIPAYNEAAVIGEVVSHVIRVMKRTGYSFEVLIVDDGSKDETAQVAATAGAKVVRHPYNIGNGAAVKNGIRHAQGSILIMMDGDGQHNPEDLPRFLELMPSFDMVVGARTRTSDTDLHRDLANQIYNILASYVCSRQIEDLTSGFRAVKASVARGFVYLLPNKFSYPSTSTLAVVRAGHSLKYIPIQVSRRVGKSKINPLRDGIRFLTIILRVGVFFAPLRVFIPLSASLFLLGIGWYFFAVFFLGRGFPPTSTLLILTSVMIFCMGLISEQIAQLRYERTE